MKANSRSDLGTLKGILGKLVNTVPDLEILEGILGKFPDHDLNGHQLDMFSRGYKIPELSEMGYTPEMYFAWLADSKDTEELVSKYWMIVRAQIREYTKEKAKEKGFSVVAVGSGDVDPDFCYSTYLTDKVGYELILVGMGGHIGGSLLNSVCDMVIKEYPDSPPTTVLTTDLFGIVIDGESHDLRLQLVELDMDSPTAKGVTLGENVTRIMQITVGDKNNLLPNEEGYDTSFIQTLSGE